MLDKIPTREELLSLMGAESFATYSELTGFVEEHYSMDLLWDKGRGEDVFELKYRRSGKTLCAIYARDHALGALVVLGKAEREKFEARRSDFGQYINDLYDRTRQYHDGRWMFLDVDSGNANEVKELILIKRKPNRKQSE